MKLCLDESRLTGTNLLLMFEKDIRGRITQVVKCYVNVNNKCIKEQYNPDEASKYFSVWMQTTFTSVQ